MLRIGVHLPPSLDQDPIFTSSVLPNLEALAQRCAQQTATLLQVEAGQFWIGHQPSPLPWHRSAVRTAMVGEDGRVAYFATETVEPLIERQFWLTAEAWRAIGEHLRTGREPALPRTLLQEAVAFRFAGKVRLSVLSCAMACEIALKTYIRDVHGTREPLYAYVVDRDRELSIFAYLDDVLTLATGKQAKHVLQGESAGQKIGYAQLRHLFEARNRVVHQGRAWYPSGSRKTEQPVTDDVLDGFIASARLLLGWLDALREEGSQLS